MTTTHRRALRTPFGAKSATTTWRDLTSGDLLHIVNTGTTKVSRSSAKAEFKRRGLTLVRGNYNGRTGLVIYADANSLMAKARGKPKPPVDTGFGYTIHDGRMVRDAPQTIDTRATGRDYGYDHVGDGPPYTKFRMVPSGDVVDYEEMRRRLPQRTRNAARGRAKKPAGDWVTTDEGFRKYKIAYAEARAKATQLNMDVGIERNDLFKEFNVFLLPLPKNRTGHELRAEVVHPGSPPMGDGARSRRKATKGVTATRSKPPTRKTSSTTSKRPKRLYIWNWIGGGHNSCEARSRAEALACAKRMGGGLGIKLKVDLRSLRVGTRQELERTSPGWDARRR